jgi:C-terminal processing protease CtpA/Prc
MLFRLGRRMIRRVAALLLLLPATALAQPATFGAKARVADLDWYIGQIAAHYAYLPDRHLDLARMRALYRPQAEAAVTRGAWIAVLEHVTAELHDHHATLGTNTPSSPQLIPSGTDIWAEYANGKAVITEVRLGSPAEHAGLHAGDEVISVDDVPVGKAVAGAMPKSLTSDDPEARNFVLRTLLAGTHDAPRKIALRGGRTIALQPYVPPSESRPVTWKRLEDATGYVRLENSLGDNGTVAALDNALQALHGSKNIILDLRNTPGGGNTDVAEPILGRFIAKTEPYQRVFDPGPGKHSPEDSWLKTVAPRPPLVNARLIVLVDHWTGSMGEGMAIGLDAMHRATIVGTHMAGLCGGTGEFVLPNTRIAVHFPIERLYHVNGTPRERWLPPVLIDMAHARGPDPILARAREVLAGLSDTGKHRRRWRATT